MYHNPVLLEQCIDGLNIRPEGTYVDATFGGGGHAKAMLARLATGRLLAFDQDPDTTNNLLTDERFTYINHNFRYLKNFLTYHNVEKIDGLLADLGISSHQIDQPERGFSTRFDGSLDMRMDQKDDVDAEMITNTYEADELIRVLSQYGEINNAPKLAGKIL